MEERQGITPGIVIGMLIVAAGTLWFLDEQGLLDAGLVFGYFWPSALIVVGLTKIGCSRRGGRIWGGLLTVIGFMFLMDHIGYVRFRWEQIWPLFVIAVGLMMIWGHLERRGGRERRSREGWSPMGGAARAPVADLNEFAIFGGGEIINDSKDFRGGEVFAMFGGYQVDLREAEIKGEEAVIHATALFGGIEFRIPPTWLPVFRGTPFLGGFSDKAHRPKIVDPAEAKRLIITGTAMFGGIEIKN